MEKEISKTGNIINEEKIDFLNFHKSLKVGSFKSLLPFQVDTMIFDE